MAVCSAGVVMKFEFKKKWGYLYLCLNSRNVVFKVSRMPSVPIKGITSRCVDGLHCLFFDYDSVNLDLVVDDFKRLQMKYFLPPALLFSTFESESCGKVYGNFHVVCLKKHNFYDAARILMDAHMDPKFVEMPVRNRFKNWVLRQSVKGDKPGPKFLGVVGENINLGYECSLAHHKFFNDFYNIDVLNNLNFDNFSKISLVDYSTWRKKYG